jgi:glutathione peroxidase
MASIYDFEVATLQGMPTPMSDYRGKTLLVVNVASACGYTPQYAGLEALYRKYKARGFEVLAFPCNQFGAQEPGTSDEIASFCSTRYDVTFPLFAKIDVNGAHAHPLFEHLKSEKPGALGTKGIKWNFTKFLVNAQGEVVERYGSSTTPEQIDAHVAALVGTTGC